MVLNKNCSSLHPCSNIQLTYLKWFRAFYIWISVLGGTHHVTFISTSRMYWTQKFLSEIACSPFWLNDHINCTLTEVSPCYSSSSVCAAGKFRSVSRGFIAPPPPVEESWCKCNNSGDNTVLHMLSAYIQVCMKFVMEFSSGSLWKNRVWRAES